MAGRLRQFVSEDARTVLANVKGWESLSGETILVTGAGGFLGSYFVRILLELNLQQILARPLNVVAGVRSLGRGRSAFSDLDDNPHLSILELDLTDIAVPELPGVTYVIHAASQASPKYYGVDPVGTLLPNTVGTAALLTSTAPSLKGFLFLSSSEVYGNAGDNSLLVESTPGCLDSTEVRACYSEGKRAGEALCVAWHAQYGVRTCIARPFHTYGPGLTENDGRVFADFVYNVVNRQDIHIRSDGTARRAFCYVSDAMAGFFTVLLSGEPATAYNVANPAGELSVAELANTVAGLFPDRGIAVDIAGEAYREGYLPSGFDRLVPCVEKLQGLGWQARVSPEEGFRRTIEAHL